MSSRSDRVTADPRTPEQTIREVAAWAVLEMRDRFDLGRGDSRSLDALEEALAAEPSPELADLRAELADTRLGSERQAARAAMAEAENTRLQAELAKAQKQTTEAEMGWLSLRTELARLLGTISTRSGVSKNDQLIAKVGGVLSERDAARAELAAAREALAAAAEPLMDERFRDRLLRHTLSNQEVGDLVEAIYERQAKALAAALASPAEAPDA